MNTFESMTAKQQTCIIRGEKPLTGDNLVVPVVLVEPHSLQELETELCGIYRRVMDGGECGPQVLDMLLSVATDLGAGMDAYLSRGGIIPEETVTRRSVLINAALDIHQEEVNRGIVGAKFVRGGKLLLAFLVPVVIGLIVGNLPAFAGHRIDCISIGLLAGFGLAGIVAARISLD